MTPAGAALEPRMESSVAIGAALTRRLRSAVVQGQRMLSGHFLGSRHALPKGVGPGDRCPGITSPRVAGRRR